jgi:nicotinamide mononucleotide adenylyltransferase
MSKEKRALFIGRWQTPQLHGGHLWCFEQKIKQGIKVLIGIRDVEVDEKNPYTAKEVLENIQNQLSEEIIEGRIKVFILPCDIESVCYGRGVGYTIEELTPPTNISEISATKIREEMRAKGEL